MGTTFTQLATANPSGTTSFTFSSIPSTYTDLVIIASYGVSNGNQLYMQFNGSNASYYNNSFYKTGSSLVSNSARNISVFEYSWSASSAVHKQLETYFLNYADASYYKGYINFFGGNASTFEVGMGGGTWRQYAAINSINIYTAGGSGTFTTRSRFALYGIKAA